MKPRNRSEHNRKCYTEAVNLHRVLIPAPDEPEHQRPFIIPVGGDGAGRRSSTLTYGDIDDRSATFAAALTSCGLVAGDRLVMQVEKSVEAVALTLACVRRGVVFIPLNTAYTPTEVSFFVADTGARLFVCSPSKADDMATAIGDALLYTLGDDGGGTLLELAETVEPDPTIVNRDDADLAAMLYTSGTTGRSKGAMLTHASLRANAEALHSMWQFQPDDIVLHTLPIFHVHGLFVALFPAMIARAAVRFCPRFDVDLVLAELPGSSVLMGVPTHYVRLLTDGRIGPTSCTSVRLFTSGSAPMTESTHQAFTEQTGHRIVERYGMTETGILTSNPIEGDQIPGTVGFALPGHQVRVVNGEVEVHLPVAFAGYWQLPDKTAESLTEDGWFRTGDIGSIDATGRLALDGRASDMIISGGYNVYPKEIELVLDAVPGVVESAVVGVPHPDFGEGVMAVVAVEPGTDVEHLRAALNAGCSDALARFKHPKHYVFVESLPRNAMAKVQKKALREQHTDVFTHSD